MKHTIPSPAALRKSLARRAAKQGVAALARDLGLSVDVVWNFISRRTKELKHSDVIRALRVSGEETP